MVAQKNTDSQLTNVSKLHSGRASAPDQPLAAAELDRELQRLADEWIRAKAEENAALRQRVSIENQILALAPASGRRVDSHQLASGWTITIAGASGYRHSGEQRGPAVYEWRGPPAISIEPKPAADERVFA